MALLQKIMAALFADEPPPLLLPAIPYFAAMQVVRLGGSLPDAAQAAYDAGAWSMQEAVQLAVTAWSTRWN